MAKFQFTDLFFGGSAFMGELELKVDSDRERAVYTDQMTGAKIIAYGDNLKEAAGTEGHFSAGVIDKLVFKTGEGEVLVTVTEGDFKAKSLNAGFTTDGVGGIFQGLFGGDDLIRGGANNEPLYGQKGDDRIYGGLGADTIYGGRGDDVLTGGKDSDTFDLQSDLGVFHDRITDLDITGNDRDYLMLAYDIEKTGKTNGGKDTLITFENGATLELDGVTRADFIDYWNTPT